MALQDSKLGSLKDKLADVADQLEADRLALENKDQEEKKIIKKSSKKK